MNTQEFTTQSAEETIDLGRHFSLFLSPPKLVVLRGELGAGKTTLVKGIVEAFHAAAQDDVTSPTFTLVHEYHGDLYRIDTTRELETLGLDDLAGPDSIVMVEWGDKFPRFERERDVEIALLRVGEDRRKIQLTTR